MWKYLIENKEWIFSGIGVFIITIIVAYFSKRKKRINEISQSDNQFNNASFDNSSINNVKGDNVNFNQTIINNLKEKILEKEKSIPIVPTPELVKVKQEFLAEKA